MRWKLLIAAALLATVAGAGGDIAIIRFFSGPTEALNRPGWIGLAVIVLPLAAITFASIFVYRHTAKRRTLQAAATAMLAIVLTLFALLFVPSFFFRPGPLTDPPPRFNSPN
jgi:hypothetical protein